MQKKIMIYLTYQSQKRDREDQGEEEKGFHLANIEVVCRVDMSILSCLMGASTASLCACAKALCLEFFWESDLLPVSHHRRL